MAYDVDMEDAFTALEALDDEGRSALRTAGLLWERLYRDALDRAERAEWLFARIEKWSTDWGLSFGVDKAAEAWDNRYRREPPVLVPWHERRIEERRQKLQALHMRLEEAIEANHRMARIADRDRLRAETAERECDELRAEDRSLRYRKGRP